MSLLRQRMIEDMQVRNLSPRTIECYVRHVASFAKHFGRSPDQLGLDEVRAYQVYLVQQKKASWATFNQAVCAFRFLPVATDIARNAAGNRGRPETLGSRDRCPGGTAYLGTEPSAPHL